LILVAVPVRLTKAKLEVQTAVFLCLAYWVELQTIKAEYIGKSVENTCYTQADGFRGLPK
jgi:hypothetical protein